MVGNIARSLPVIAACALLTCSLSTCQAGTPFIKETVDASGSVGQYTSLALDGRGNPHISYYDAGNAHLKYAVKLRGAWSVETVDAEGDVGQYSSLALDAQGDPHIGYYDATNGALKYAVKSTGSWTVEMAASGGAGYYSMGQYCSLKLDGEGRPHVSCYAPTRGVVYCTKPAGAWISETVSVTGYSALAGPPSLALDARGNPHISYVSPVNSGSVVSAVRLLYSSGWILGTIWVSYGTYSSLALDVSGAEHSAYYDSQRRALGYDSPDNRPDRIVDESGDVGQYPSLALDAQGNPRISYYDASNGALKYCDSAVHLLSPSGGETWPVGAVRRVEWSGVGPVDVLLSADGGANYVALETGVTTSPWEFRVPLLPTRFARLKIARGTPVSTALSDSFFTIEASVALLAFKAEVSQRGAVLSWSTRPGPEDLAGYRLERARSEGWETIVELTRQTVFVDPQAGPGTSYRLSAVNGLGQPLVLGETAVRPTDALAAWPLPYRGGALQISFGTSGGMGGGTGPAVVDVYDAAGRRVRTLTRGEYPAGYQMAVWDGRDDRGRTVPSGLYIIRALTGGGTRYLKLVTLR